MDENGSREDEIGSFDDKEEYSDVEEPTDSLSKTIELIEVNAKVLDEELGEAIAEVKVAIICVSRCFTGFLAAYLKSLVFFLYRLKVLKVSRARSATKFASQKVVLPDIAEANIRMEKKQRQANKVHKEALHPDSGHKSLRKLDKRDCREFA